MLRTTLGPVPLLAVLFSAPGCSYALVHGPPSPVESRDGTREVQLKPPDCTSSNDVPILDTVLAVPLLGLGAALLIDAAATSPSSDWFGPTRSQVAAVGAGGLALGVVFLSSAITGYGRTADCRRARESSAHGLPADRTVPP